MRSVLLATAMLAAGALAGEAPEPPKITPPTEAEIKAELDKETPEQKKLRAELEALAKAGQRIYFNANCTGTDQVYVAGPDGSGCKQLTAGPHNNDYAHCSPDGKTVAFVSDRVKLQKGKAVPEELKDLPVDPKVPLKTGGQWDRFGTKATTESSPNVIWTMKADGSDPKPLAFGIMPHWSPDGRFLAYSIYSRPFKNQLVIMDMEKKAETCISHPGIKNFGMPCFSPDGQYLVGANGAAHCVKLNAEKTAVENVFVFNRGHPCNGELSPDGKHWAYVVDTSRDQGGWLCYQEMDYVKPGGKETKLKLGWANGSVNYFPDFSPCGKYLVYAHADQQPGVKSWLLKSKQELYVTRFPGCEATVRITWNGGANQHPHWWGPPAGK